MMRIPKMTTDEAISLWAGRVSRGVQIRHDRTQKHWDNLRRFLLGEQWDLGGKEASQVDYKATVNICWHLMRSYVPALYMDDPHLLVRPDPNPDTPYEDLQQPAKKFEALINREWRIDKVKRQIRDVIADVLVMCYGCIKTGWFEVDHHTYRNITVGDKPRNKEAFAKRVAPADVVVDPDAKSFKSIRWVAETWVRPYYDVMNDGRYVKCKDLKDLQPSFWASDAVGITAESDPDRYQGNEDVAKRDGWIKIWEVMTYEDANETRAGKLYTFAQAPATGENSLDAAERHAIEFSHLLREADLPYDYLEGFPYHFLTFNDVPDFLYGPSDLQMAEDLQKEYNYLRSIQADQVRNQKTVWAYQQDKLTPGEAKKLAEAPANAFVPIESNDHMQNILFPIQSTAVPADLYKTLGDIKGEIWEVTGMDQAARNMSMADETATAVMQRGKHSSLRMADRALVVKDWVIGIAYDYARIILNENPDEREVMVMLKDEMTGQESEARMAIGDFKMQFKVDLEAKNTFPVSREIELSQFLSAVNLTANNPNVNQRELAVRVFEMFDIHAIDQLIPPAPSAEIMRALEAYPELMEHVAALIQQAAPAIEQQRAEQQGQGQAPNQRVMADPNEFQKTNVPNQGNASAAQGGRT